VTIATSIVGLHVAFLGVKAKDEETSERIEIMWSSHLIAFAAALCALSMSASAAAKASGGNDENGGNWVTLSSTVLTSDTVVGYSVRRFGPSSQLMGGRGKKSMARDYARILEALSRAVQQTTRRRRSALPS
jgi:hypothetical protein